MTLTDIHHFGAYLLDHYIPLAVAAILVIAVGLLLARRRLKHAWLDLKTRYRLNHLGLREISNFKFPDGLGNHFTIDRLIMRQDGISLLMYKSYPGSIFCAEGIDEWTQLLAGKSYRFKNPLVDLDYQVNAISAYIPDVPVNGFLFFDHQARFPKGRPERVIGLDTVPQSLRRNKNTSAKPSVVSGWEKLRATA